MSLPLVLALLLAASCAAQQGEYCHGWADGHGSWHPGFHCPEKRYDPQEATFCCGSCALRYCCTAREARLDQGLCPSEEPGGGVPVVEQAEAVPMYVPFLLVGSVFVMFVLVGSLVGVCCCKCVKPPLETDGSGPASTQSHLLNTEPSRDLSRNSDSSSSLAPRASLAVRPPNMCPLGSDSQSVFMNMTAPFAMMGCPQGSPFICTTAGTPYMNYGVPPEHSIVLNQAAYMNAMSCYGSSINAYGQNLNPYPTLTQQSEHIIPNGSPPRC
uniref:Shisa N-terminal domain-containing protein n=1 Tax=Leptobrachium leishanense TaxID=445787 RepID=A0A8C5PP17_9ANUR